MDRRKAEASYHSSQGRAFDSTHNTEEQLGSAPKPAVLPGHTAQAGTAQRLSAARQLFASTAALIATHCYI